MLVQIQSTPNIGRKRINHLTKWHLKSEKLVFNVEYVIITGHIITQIVTLCVARVCLWVCVCVFDIQKCIKLKNWEGKLHLTHLQWIFNVTITQDYTENKVRQKKVVPCVSKILTRLTCLWWFDWAQANFSLWLSCPEKLLLMLEVIKSDTKIILLLVLLRFSLNPRYTL